MEGNKVADREMTREALMGSLIELQRLRREKAGWVCLARMLAVREKEIERLKETAYNFQLGMERAEQRAGRLAEALTKLRNSKSNTTSNSPKLTTDVFIPSSMKQLVDMLTTENVRLYKCLNKDSQLPKGAEIWKRCEQLEEEVAWLQRQCATKEENVNQLSMILEEGTTHERITSILEPMVARQALEDKVRKLQKYTIQLREKNTSLLMALVNILSDKETSTGQEKKQDVVTSNHVVESGPIKERSNANDDTKENQNTATNAGSSQVEDLLAVEARLKCCEDTLNEKDKSICELEEKNSYLVRSCKENQDHIDSLKAELCETNSNCEHIIQAMQHRVEEANNENKTLETICREQEEEIKKLKENKREKEEQRKQIFALQERVFGLQNRNRVLENAQQPQPVMMAMPPEPSFESNWAFRSHSDLVVVADSPSAVKAQTTIPGSPNQASSSEKYFHGTSSSSYGNRSPDDEDFICCGNCKDVYPSHVFEDHLKDCSRE